MPRNTTAVQKRAQDFHKNDMLAQKNEIKYDCFFFCMAQETKNCFLKI